MTEAPPLVTVHVGPTCCTGTFVQANMPGGWLRLRGIEKATEQYVSIFYDKHLTSSTTFLGDALRAPPLCYRGGGGGNKTTRGLSKCDELVMVGGTLECVKAKSNVVHLLVYRPHYIIKPPPKVARGSTGRAYGTWSMVRTYAGPGYAPPRSIRVKVMKIQKPRGGGQKETAKVETRHLLDGSIKICNVCGNTSFDLGIVHASRWVSIRGILVQCFPVGLVMQANEAFAGSVRVRILAPSRNKPGTSAMLCNSAVKRRVVCTFTGLRSIAHGRRASLYVRHLFARHTGLIRRRRESSSSGSITDDIYFRVVNIHATGILPAQLQGKKTITRDVIRVLMRRGDVARDKFSAVGMRVPGARQCGQTGINLFYSGSMTLYGAINYEQLERAYQWFVDTCLPHAHRLVHQEETKIKTDERNRHFKAATTRTITRTTKNLARGARAIRRRQDFIGNDGLVPLGRRKR